MKKLLRRLFGGPKLVEDGDTWVDTPPLEGDPEDTLIEEGPIKIEPPQLIAGAARSVGMKRDHNEDSLFTMTTTIGTETSSIPFGMYIVADGMGGHEHGEVASETAVRTMSDWVFQHLYMPVYGVNGEQPVESMVEIFSEGILQANKAVAEQAPGGGTTLTTVVIIGNRMTIAHVGDSRAYAIYDNSEMQLLTRDHSLVRRLEEMGQITSQEADVHPQKNVLYRALGQSEPFEPDVTTAPVPQPGSVLICSDGLWGLVPDDEMYQLIATSENPQEACQRLIQAANEAGGNDNITAILIRIPD